VKKGALAAILAVLILLLTLSSVALGSAGFAIGPPSISVTVPADGESTAYVYVTSGFDGKIVVGTEDIPFRVEPGTIPVSSTDQNKKVELTFYGDKSIEEGTYSGKLTFLAYTGNNVAYGVKLNADVTQVGQKQVSQAVEESAGTPFISTIKDNYIVAILGVLVVVALLVGIVIGRKRRQET